jgi:hypothetical protein
MSRYETVASVLDNQATSLYFGSGAREPIEDLNQELKRHVQSLETFNQAAETDTVLRNYLEKIREETLSDGMVKKPREISLYALNKILNEGIDLAITILGRVETRTKAQEISLRNLRLLNTSLEKIIAELPSNSNPPAEAVRPGDPFSPR